MPSDVLERAEMFVYRIDANGTWPSDGRDGADILRALAAEVRELRNKLSDADDALQGATGLTPGDQIKIDEALAAMAAERGEGE